MIDGFRDLPVGERLEDVLERLEERLEDRRARACALLELVEEE